MHKYIIALLAVLIACGFAARRATKVCLGEVCVNAEIADTEPERAKGLMFRDALCDGCAMLFMFEEEKIYPFWMKNMKFAIDIIWIDGDKRITDIQADCPPCPKGAEGYCGNIIPRSKARYVLEVRAGFCEDNHIGISDEVRFK